MLNSGTRYLSLKNHQNSATLVASIKNHHEDPGWLMPKHRYTSSAAYMGYINEFSSALINTGGPCD